jgi:thiol-disulfide isomerase/thioredoxin
MKAFRSALLGLLLLAAAGTAAHAQDVGLPLGATPSPVVIEDLEGNAVDLGEFIGKRPVMLQFWAQWCEICEELLPQVRAAKKKFGDRAEFLLVGVAVNQTPRSIKRHVAKHRMPGRVLWDVNGRATRAFMAPSTSYVVVLDKRGSVVYTGVGEEQDIVAAVQKAMRR